MVLVLTEKDILELADLESVMSVTERALCDYSSKRTVMPPRLVMEIAGKPGTLRAMLAALPDSEVSGLKLLAGTAGKRSPDKTYFTIMLTDFDGALRCIMGANYLTQLRTGAASAVATKYLARKDAKKLGVIGCGVQGLAQIEAISHVREFDGGFVYDIDPVRAKKATEFARDKLGLELRIGNSPGHLAGEVDVLITATTSKEPILDDNVVHPGIHINAIGSNLPSRRELGEGLLRKAKLVVDSLEQALKESGDFIGPISKGSYDASSIYGEIGEIASGKKHGRVSEDEITLFKSVGIAIEDIAVANLVYGQAVSKGVGTELNI